MKDINRVLACVDLSEYSKMVIEHALEFAKGVKHRSPAFQCH